MSTFFRQEEIYVTEEELEKTYNYIKNMMDSKISQIQTKLIEIQQKSQLKEQVVHPDINQQILDINNKIIETEKLESKITQIDNLVENIEELKTKVQSINEEIEKVRILIKQEISTLNNKIEVAEEQLNEFRIQQINELDITMQLEEMAQQKANQEQIDLLKNKIGEIEETTSLQGKNLLEIKNNISYDNTKKNEKFAENFKKVKEQIDLQIKKIEAETKERVEEKLFEQNVEVQKVEQLLTLKMNKNSEEARNIREEIERAKLKIEEIELDCKNDENNSSIRYEIEQKMHNLKNHFENQIKIAEEKFNEELKIKIEELERQNEEKMRKIVEKILEEQINEKSKKDEEIIPQEEITQISQILAIIK